MRALVFGAEIDPLDRPQDVAGREDHDRRRRSPPAAWLKFQTESTTNTSPMKPHSPGRPSPAKKMPIARAAVDRHPGEQAAELVEVAVMHAVVDDADQKNMPAELMPWAIIWNIAPFMPIFQ